MKENIAPEEKLLRLIRGPKKQAQGGPANIAAKTPARAKFAGLKFRLPANLDVNRIIRIAFILASLYLAFSLLYPFFGIKKIKLASVTKEITVDKKDTDEPAVKPYEYYAADLKNRQIFGTPAAQQAAGPVSAANADLIKDISLVGIISGENPQAVIEDKKSQKTYYLTSGQFIGEIQVEKILDGKIILNYKGERFELYL